MHHLICKPSRCVLHPSNNVALQGSDWNLTEATGPVSVSGMLVDATRHHASLRNF